MYSFPQLKRFLKKDTNGFNRVKIALLADHASQFLQQAIKGYGAANHFDFEIYEADYNQIEQQVFDEGSDLYAFGPQIVLIIRSAEHLLNSFYKQADRQGFHDRSQKDTQAIYEQLSRRLNANIILNTYTEINDYVFGNYGSKTSLSFIYQVRKINLALMELAQQRENLHICDVASLSAIKGYEFAFDPKTYVSTDMVFSLDFLPLIAGSITGIVNSMLGRSKKCLILDLDNTLWGGIIGDDGIENIQIGSLGIGKAFTEFQLWCRELKDRGIILGVCSKNTEHIARQPFSEHPDMVLRDHDISIFVANWENKVDNIRYIQKELNISMDSMVFLDDNPFEREMVSTAIPELTVPELPEDPADYLQALRIMNLFDTTSFTNEDKNRTDLYRLQAVRSTMQRNFTDESAYLQSLGMQAKVGQFDRFSIPRVAQLTLRSNQFNLRTVRYTEQDIVNIASSGDFLTMSFSLEDKFGDNGLIAVVILRKQEKNTLFIDTWIMSCRVLKRSMENYTLNKIVTAALSNGFNRIIGEYIPTPKNGIVASHYQYLGFTPKDDTWELDLTTYTNKTTFITD